MTATDLRTDTASPLRLAVLIGSVRDGRFGPVIARWFAERARAHGGFEVDVIDLAEDANTLPLVFPGPHTPPDAAVERVRSGLSARLHAADSFVVITPEYNHSFPAALKNTIDWFREEWTAKPVGLVTYGGMAGGQRAAEQLRQIFPELHAVTVRDSLSFNLMQRPFDEHGRPRDEEGVGLAAAGMLRSLQWWGAALRGARERTPYAVA